MPRLETPLSFRPPVIPNERPEGHSAALTSRSAFGAQSTRPSSEGHASVPEADETTREQAKDEVRRGEVTVSVVTERDIEEHVRKHSVGLVDMQRATTVSVPGSLTFGDFQLIMSKKYRIDPSSQVWWRWGVRPSGAIRPLIKIYPRPDAPVTGSPVASEEKRMAQLVDTDGRVRLLLLPGSMEDSRRNPDARHSSTITVVNKAVQESTESSGSCLLFLKVLNKSQSFNQIFKLVGVGEVPRHLTVAEAVEVLSNGSFQGGTALHGTEEISCTRIVEVDMSQRLEDLDHVDGDVLIVESVARGRRPLVENYFKWYQDQGVKVTFCPVRSPTATDLQEHVVRLPAAASIAEVFNALAQQLSLQPDEVFLAGKTPNEANEVSRGHAARPPPLRQRKLKPLSRRNGFGTLSSLCEDNNSVQLVYKTRQVVEKQRQGTAPSSGQLPDRRRSVSDAVSASYDGVLVANENITSNRVSTARARSSSYQEEKQNIGSGVSASYGNLQVEPEVESNGVIRIEWRNREGESLDVVTVSREYEEPTTRLEALVSKIKQRVPLETTGEIRTLQLYHGRISKILRHDLLVQYLPPRIYMEEIEENQVRISSSCALASFCVLMPFNGTHAGAVSSDVLSATVLTADPTGIASDASRRESASIMFAMGSARLSESSPSPMKAEDCFFSVAYPPFLNVVSSQDTPISLRRKVMRRLRALPDPLYIGLLRGTSRPGCSDDDLTLFQLNEEATLEDHVTSMEELRDPARVIIVIIMENPSSGDATSDASSDDSVVVAPAERRSNEPAVVSAEVPIPQRRPARPSEEGGTSAALAVEALKAQLRARTREAEEKTQTIRGLQAEVASLRTQLRDRLKESDRSARQIEELREQLRDERDTASSLQESVRIAGEELRRVSSLHEELLRERRGREEAESKVIRLERQLERNSSVEGSSSLRSEVTRLEEELRKEKECRRQAESAAARASSTPNRAGFTPSSAGGLHFPNLQHVNDQSQLERMEKDAEQFMKAVRAAQVELLRRQKEELEEAKKCKVCQERDITVVLVPCGHHCLCHDCSLQLEECPLCRAKISQRLKTYA